MSPVSSKDLDGGLLIWHPVSCPVQGKRFVLPSYLMKYFNSLSAVRHAQEGQAGTVQAIKTPSLSALPDSC